MADRSVYVNNALLGLADHHGDESEYSVMVYGVGGTSGSVDVIKDIQDGAGDSVMDAANDAIRVSLVAGGGTTVLSSGSFARPNDANAYAAGDVITDSTSVPTVITFSGCARVNNGSGIIIGAQCIDSANQSTKPTLELWLFDTTFTPDNDNAVFTPTDGELATLVGIIQFNLWFVGDATAGAGGNCVSLGALTEPMAFVTGASSTSLFGILVVRNAYTPVAQEQFTIRLRVLQD